MTHKSTLLNFNEDKSINYYKGGSIPHFLDDWDTSSSA